MKKVNVSITEGMVAKLYPNGHTEVKAWDVEFVFGNKSHILCVEYDWFEEEWEEEMPIDEARAMWNQLASDDETIEI